MDLFETFRKRRSVRNFTSKAVEKDKVQKLMEAALLIPSGHAYYPLQYIVIDDREVLDKLSGLRVEGTGKMLKSASLAIAIIGDTEKSNTWIEDASCAAENIYLASESLGLGSCWIQCRLRNAYEGKTTESFVKDVLGYPDNMQTECIMAIGYPENHAPARTSDELDFSKIHYNSY